MWLCVSRCPLLQLHLGRQTVCSRFPLASNLLQANQHHFRSLNCHRNSGVRRWCSSARAVAPRSALLCSVGQRRLGVFLLPARTLVSGQQLPSLPSTEELVKKHGCLRRAFKSRIKNKYILDPALAAVVVDHLGDLSENKQWIFELNAVHQIPPMARKAKVAREELEFLRSCKGLPQKTKRNTGQRGTLRSQLRDLDAQQSSTQTCGDAVSQSYNNEEGKFFQQPSNLELEKGMQADDAYVQPMWSSCQPLHSSQQDTSFPDVPGVSSTTEVADYSLSGPFQSTGPGVVTRELLAAGASRILVLENDRVFLPYSMALARHVGKRLHVKYADFFRIDPMGDGIVKQPAISSVELFNNVQPAHWKEEAIVRVVGMLSQEKEKTHLRHLCYRVLERSSLFEYGRMELNLFITEKVYNMITAPPGVDLVVYESTSILCQVCFDIQLLLKEPNSRFLPVQVKGQTNYKRKANADRFVNDHMCLVRLTPKASLFDQGLTPQNGSQFIFLVRQLMAKPRAKLADRMEIWVPGSLDILSDLGLRPDMRAGDLAPSQFMQLFLLLLKNGSFHNTWWEDEAYEQIHSINNRAA